MREYLCIIKTIERQQYSLFTKVRSGLTAVFSAAVLAAASVSPVLAEEYETVVDTADAGDIQEEIIPDDGGSGEGDLSGLIEVVSEKSSDKGERLEDVRKEPVVAPVPAAPPSNVLNVSAPEPYRSPSYAAMEYWDEYRAADLKFSSDTLFYTCTRHTTESGFYYLTHVIVADVSQLDGLLSNDVFGGARETPLSAAKRTGAAILLNGSYFSYETNTPTGGTLMIKDNRVLSGEYADGYEVCLRSDGTLFSPGYNTVSSVLAQNVRFSWGTCEDLLIRDGKQMKLTDLDWDSSYYPRTSVGMVRPLEYYFITAGMAGYVGGLTVFEEQEIFQELGCWYARGLDGGGSSALVIGGEYVNQNGDITESGLERRPVADFIAVYEDTANKTSES